MILLSIYLTGYAVLYFVLKIMIKENELWTVNDRRCSLCLSLTSWLGIIAVVLACVISQPNNIKPAKW